jgi:SNF2 family DNA or RNA helicase
MPAQQSKGFGFLFEMGCGKTITAIATMGALWKYGKVNRVLVVAPSSVCGVWPKEMEEMAEFPFTVAVMAGDKKKRLAALDHLRNTPKGALQMAIINYESTWRDGIF